MGAPRDARAQDESFEVRGLLQTWATLVDQDESAQADPAGYGDPEHDPGLSIHRARLGIVGAREALSWDLTLGYAEPYDAVEAFGAGESIGLVDANAAWRWGPVQGEGTSFTLSGGLQKVPYLRDALMSARDLTFQERSVATQWLDPGREVGVVGDLYTGSGLRARLGVFGGNGALDGDDNTGKLMAARLEWGSGDGYRTWDAGREDALSVAVSGMYDLGVATNTTSVNVDALFRVQRFTTWFQVTQQSEAPARTDLAVPDVLAPISQRGMSLQASYFVPTGDREPAGVEVSARASLYDAGTSLQDNGDVLIGQLGATWRDVAPGVDLGAGYVHRQELAGRALANDTVRVWAQVRAGRAVSGSRGGGPVANAWRRDFLGTWKASGDLDGAVIAFWEQPGLGLVGSFQMTEPRGKVVVGRLYPLDSFMYADRTLRVRMDPYGENRDVVWFELTPTHEGELCGFGYEDGRRADVVAGVGGGSWICWAQQSSEDASASR